MVIALVALTIWMLLLLIFGSFSAFGTACDSCQDEIDRGTLILLATLTTTYLVTVGLATRADVARSRVGIVVAGGAVGLLFTIAVVVFLMPI